VRTKWVAIVKQNHLTIALCGRMSVLVKEFLATWNSCAVFMGLKWDKVYSEWYISMLCYYIILQAQYRNAKSYKGFMFVCFCFFFAYLFIWWYWSLNSSPHACRLAMQVLYYFESLPQPYFFKY
jgi:hypothetical protein